MRKWEYIDFFSKLNKSINNYFILKNIFIFYINFSFLVLCRPSKSFVAASCLSFLCPFFSLSLSLLFLSSFSSERNKIPICKWEQEGVRGTPSRWGRGRWTLRECWGKELLAKSTVWLYDLSHVFSCFLKILILFLFRNNHLGSSMPWRFFLFSFSLFLSFENLSHFFCCSRWWTNNRS